MTDPALSERAAAMIKVATQGLGDVTPRDSEGTWQAKYSATALTIVDAIKYGWYDVLPPIADALRDRITALEVGDNSAQSQRQIGYLSGLLAVLRQWAQREPVNG